MKSISMNPFLRACAFWLMANLPANGETSDHARLKSAFYDWWEVAQQGLGPGVRNYVNIEAFRNFYALGADAASYLDDRIRRDRMNPYIMEYAKNVLNQKVPWTPGSNPVPQRDLIEENAEPYPVERRFDPLTCWSVHGAAHLLATANHPRLSRNRSWCIRPSAEGLPVELVAVVALDQSNFYGVYATITVQGSEANWTMHATVEWLDRNDRPVRIDTLPLFMSNEANRTILERTWLTCVVEFARPAEATKALVRISTAGHELSNNRQEAMLFLDKIRFIPESNGSRSKGATVSGISVSGGG
jgi:hypothetical protein